MNHKDLEVWKKSMDLVALVYQLTNDFPDTEKFGLTKSKTVLKKKSTETV